MTLNSYADDPLIKTHRNKKSITFILTSLIRIVSPPSLLLPLLTSCFGLTQSKVANMKLTYFIFCTVQYSSRRSDWRKKLVNLIVSGKVPETSRDRTLPIETLTQTMFSFRVICDMWPAVASNEFNSNPRIS